MCEGIVNRPHGITVGPDGEVFCVDQADHAVYRFNDGKPQGHLGTVGVASATGFANRDQATITGSDVPFNEPTKLAVDPDGRLAVTDGYGNARVHSFSYDGRHRAAWGEPGSAPGQFRLPHSLAFDKTGLLAVADRENDRIQVFDDSLEVVAIWPVQRPAALAFHPSGLVFVASLPRRPGQVSYTKGRVEDFRPAAIVVLDRGGEEQACLESGDLGAEIAAPHGLAVTADTLYLAEVPYSDAVASEVPVPENCWPIKKFRIDLEQP